MTEIIRKEEFSGKVQHMVAGRQVDLIMVIEKWRKFIMKRAPLGGYWGRAT